MTLIELLFLSISLIGFYTYFKIKVSLKNTNNSFMEKEAARILFKDCEANLDYEPEGRFYKRAIALIKDKKNNKYNLISQAKICENGLN